MSEQQIAKLAGALVEHQRHFGAMSKDDRQWVIQNTKDAIGIFANAVKKRGVNGKNAGSNKVLEPVTTVLVAAVESFKAPDGIEIYRMPGVDIYHVDWNFKVNFLGLSEGACGAAGIKVHKLLEHSLDATIVTELGRECETKLGQFFALLSRQGKGQTGAFLVNGDPNIAYIRDAHGELWAISAFWEVARGGWHLGARPVEKSQYKWFRGFQVLSL